MRDWLLPIVVRVLTGLGRTIVPVIATYIGYTETEVGDWWLGVANLAGALIVTVVSAFVDRWWTRKTAAKAVGDANQAAFDAVAREVQP